MVLSGRSLETRVALIWAGVRCAATGRRRLRVAVSVCAMAAAFDAAGWLGAEVAGPGGMVLRVPVDIQTSLESSFGTKDVE